LNGSQAERVAVIGGGVIGAMSAWYLSQAGYRVTILDRDRFGAACSHGNCGYVSPSHILPLTRPGAIKSTLFAMMKKNSPFAIKPRFNRNSLSWFWNFARRCNQRDMMDSAQGLHILLQSAKQLYQQLIEAEQLDCEWQEVGLLFVFDDDNEFEAFGKTDRLLRENFGVAATPYAEDELLKLEPAIKPGVTAGAWHYELDCHLRPDKLMSGLRLKLEERGVKFVEVSPVESFVCENGRAKAVNIQTCENRTRQIEADHFVVATGAWTPFLNEHLGCRIPIEPGKGYSITMPTPALMPKIPMIFEDCHVAITPMTSKYRIGSTMEFVGYDTSINPKRMSLLRAAAERYLRDPLCAPVEEEWFGWRPMTWDGKPVIDRSPKMNNVVMAVGHNMIGLSTATATGKLVEELISGEEPHLDVSHFSVGRFDKS